jgi:acetyl esterase/lipase
VPNFALDSVEHAVADIKVIVAQAPVGAPVVLAGASSGATLAHVAAHELGLPAILLVPVLDPAKRHDGLPCALQTAQLHAFKNLAAMLAWENAIPAPTSQRVVIAAIDDVRTDPSAYIARGWNLLPGVRSHHFKTGHSLCNTPPRELIHEEALRLAAAPMPIK